LFLACAVVFGTVGNSAVAHAEQGSAGGGAFGGDRAATGQLLGDGSAQASARDGADDESRPRRGGGNVVCRYYDEGSGEPVNPWHLPEFLNGEQVQIVRDCVDADTGEYVSFDVIIVTPPLGPNADSDQLAAMASSRLPLPLPEARMNPNGDQTVNVPSWLWVENWQAETRTATAGNVTSTVVATPVEQRWTFGSLAERVVCRDAGTRYDMSRPSSEQTPSCSYTFRHSSAGQPGDAYRVVVTLVWHVTWTSNIGASGDLGLVSRTRTIPTRVAEHQALNDTGSRP
jgi:hypothetical protein